MVGLFDCCGDWRVVDVGCLLGCENLAQTGRNSKAKGIETNCLRPTMSAKLVSGTAFVTASWFVVDVRVI